MKIVVQPFNVIFSIALRILYPSLFVSTAIFTNQHYFAISNIRSIKLNVINVFSSFYLINITFN
jgi:hypothetical protein